MRKVKVFTGIRPTGGLTVANYLGAVEPIVSLQKKGEHPMVFVADFHALTDNEPKVVRKNINEVVADYIALGLNPQKASIFIQSALISEVSILTNLLSRLTPVSELLRIPTLKDKIKNNANPETANTFLLLYPVMMAADILLQRAAQVPVGEDQVPHIEFTREIARRFNTKYGNVFPLPTPQKVKSLRILSLRGESKMSKSIPEGALFLADSRATVAEKIKRAQTANQGEMSESLKSHITVLKGLSKNKSVHNQVDKLIKAHMRGEAVMGKFKELMTKTVQEFLKDFQNKKAEIEKDPYYISGILSGGNKIARENAKETMRLVYKAMKIDYF